MEQRVILSSLSYHPQGFLDLELAPSSQFVDRARRVTRTQTLDGGVEIEDGGFTHGDRTFRVVVAASEAILVQLRFLVDTFPLLHCALAEGMFCTAPQSLSYVNGQATLLLLVKSKEA